MLDLEIVPERSLGCDAWEFVLGEILFISNVNILRCICKAAYAMVFLLVAIDRSCVQDATTAHIYHNPGRYIDFFLTLSQSNLCVRYVFVYFFIRNLDHEVIRDALFS
jgi:hypothetical protein